MEEKEIEQVKSQQLFNMANVIGLKVPLAFRFNSSDKWLLNKIFNEEEYKFNLHNFKPKIILDCGANVGYSATYFATKYPEAGIIAIEPEAENYQMLTYNTHFFDNIKCIRAAIWNEEGYIKILPDCPGNTLAFMTEETSADDPNALKTLTISKLISMTGYDEIDLLKIDIEGAEKEVFSADDVYEWLPHIKVLTIELHDRMKVGCSHTFFNAISKFNYVMDIRGENLLFVRQDLIASMDWNGNIYLK